MNDDQLAVGIDAVQGVQAGNEQRDRPDHHDQGGQGQHRHVEEQPERLALGRHEIDFLERLRHPDDAGQHQERDHEGAGDNTENVAANKVHPLSVTRPTHSVRRYPSRHSLIALDGENLPTIGPVPARTAAAPSRHPVGWCIWRRSGDQALVTSCNRIEPAEANET